MTSIEIYLSSTKLGGNLDPNNIEGQKRQK